MALARFLNTAPGWTVKHQNDSENHRLGYRLPKHWRRFAKPNYGEVSCALLPVLGGLPCAHKAVIVRDLRDTAVSAANLSVKAGMGDKVPLIEELEFTLKMLDAWLASGARKFEYETLFSSRRNIEVAAEQLGMGELGEFDIHARHNTGAKKFRSFSDLPTCYQEMVRRASWFQSLWGPS